MGQERDSPNQDEAARAHQESGKTLVVNAVGRRGFGQAVGFLKALKRSHGSEELGVVSVFGVGEQVRVPLERLLAGRFPLNLLRPKPVVVIENLDLAFGEIERWIPSGEYPVGTAFHFISYETGEEYRRDILESFTSSVPNLLHLGILNILVENIRGRDQYRADLASGLASQWGLPLVLVDKEPEVAEQLTIASESLPISEAYKYGLAGLVVNQKLFPHLNRDNHLRVVRDLANDSSVIGVSLAQTIAHRYGILGAINADAVGLEMVEIMAQTLTGRTSLTSLGRKRGASLDVVVAQLPLSHRNAIFKGDRLHRNFSFRTAEIAVRRYRATAPQRLVLSHGHSDFEYWTRSWAPLVATHLYPASSI